MSFIRFHSHIKHLSLPNKFTFPFYYEPHELSKIACRELQEYLQTQTDFEHNFDAIGKMFGVLVVKNKNGELGYLSAFSGKLADSNHHQYFVPPVFDMLTKDSYFLQEELKLNSYNDELELLETSTEYQILKNKLETTKEQAQKEVSVLKTKMSDAKQQRKKQRKLAQEKLPKVAFEQLSKELNQQSIGFKVALKHLQLSWDKKIESCSKDVSEYQSKIDHLKDSRKQKSNELQNYLFEQYQFLNRKGETKHLLGIFKNSPLQRPPAAAGECAAPKLLQYAFIHNLTPICMAEFWWGTSPTSEIRKHQNFYPACQGKCKPILSHMLEGMKMDINPLTQNLAIGKEITTLFEDEYLLVINKPEEFLSVPGRVIQDSVATRMKHQYPKASGPLIVHRLDMSTSGLMLIAKAKEIHEKLQAQFIKRTIKKRYVALLDGVLSEEKGEINLPLCLDFNDRPKQKVCYEQGKKAKTIWEIIKVENNKTKVYFYPITGRTHQLRVHAAHFKGLNLPIVGDDLYGKKSNRLHLHAEQITFQHPITKEEMTIRVEAPF